MSVQGVKRSSRRKTLNHSEIDDFLSTLGAPTNHSNGVNNENEENAIPNVSVATINALTPSGKNKVVSQLNKDVKSGENHTFDKTQRNLNVSDEEMIRQYCKETFPCKSSSFDAVASSTRVVDICRKLLDRTKYPLLPRRTTHPKEFPHHPDSLESKRALLLGLAPMLEISSKQKQVDVRRCQQHTRCAVSAAGRKGSYLYTCLESNKVICAREYQTRYYEFIKEDRRINRKNVPTDVTTSPIPNPPAPLLASQSQPVLINPAKGDGSSSRTRRSSVITRSNSSPSQQLLAAGGPTLKDTVFPISVSSRRVSVGASPSSSRIPLAVRGPSSTPLKSSALLSTPQVKEKLSSPVTPSVASGLPIPTRLTTTPAPLSTTKTNSTSSRLTPNIEEIDRAFSLDDDEKDVSVSENVNSPQDEDITLKCGTPVQQECEERLLQEDDDMFVVVSSVKKVRSHRSRRITLSPSTAKAMMLQALQDEENAEAVSGPTEASVSSFMNTQETLQSPEKCIDSDQLTGSTIVQTVVSEPDEGESSESSESVNCNDSSQSTADSLILDHHSVENSTLMFGTSINEPTEVHSCQKELTQLLSSDLESGTCPSLIIWRTSVSTRSIQTVDLIDHSLADTALGSSACGANSPNWSDHKKLTSSFEELGEMQVTINRTVEPNAGIEEIRCDSFCELSEWNLSKDTAEALLSTTPLKRIEDKIYSESEEAVNSSEAESLLEYNTTAIVTSVDTSIQATSVVSNTDSDESHEGISAETNDSKSIELEEEAHVPYLTSVDESSHEEKIEAAAARFHTRQQIAKWKYFWELSSYEAAAKAGQKK